MWDPPQLRPPGALRAASSAPPGCVSQAGLGAGVARQSLGLRPRAPCPWSGSLGCAGWPLASPRHPGLSRWELQCLPLGGGGATPWPGASKARLATPRHATPRREAACCPTSHTLGQVPPDCPVPGPCYFLWHGQSRGSGLMMTRPGRQGWGRRAAPSSQEAPHTWLWAATPSWL